MTKLPALSVVALAACTIRPSSCVYSPTGTPVIGADSGGPRDFVTSEVGTHPLPVARDDVDLYALTHNETSTGVMMPILRPEGAAPPAAPVPENDRLELDRTKSAFTTVNVIRRVYEIGRKVADNFKATMTILFDELMPKWNYVALPQ